MNNVCELLEVQQTDSISVQISNEIRNYKKFMSIQKGRNAKDCQVRPTENPVIFDKDQLDTLQQQSQPKRPRYNKSFEDLSVFRRRKRTEEILELMKTNHHNTVRHLLGYLLYRTEYHQGNKKLAKMGVMMINGQIS